MHNFTQARGLADPMLVLLTKVDQGKTVSGNSKGKEEGRCFWQHHSPKQIAPVLSNHTFSYASTTHVSF